MGPGGYVHEAPLVRSAANPVPCGARCGCSHDLPGVAEVVRTNAASEAVVEHTHESTVVEMTAPPAEALVEAIEAALAETTV